MFGTKKIPVLKVIFVIWVIFATLYVGYNEYRRVQVMVAQRAYNTGMRDAVTQLIIEAQKCQPIPVTAGEQKATLISLECLEQKPPAEMPEQ